MKIASYLIVLLFFFPTSGICEGSIVKPEAPHELAELLIHFSEMEESFEEKNWSTAGEHISQANSLIGKILPNLRKNTDSKHLRSFRMKFMELKDAVDTRNYDFTEEGYVDMQKSFFVLTDYYNFKTPLFLEVVGKYINEAAESFAEKNFEDVIAEMNEISEFIDTFDKQLSSHGVKAEDIESFIMTAYRVKKAAEKGTMEKIEEGLKQLRDLHAGFIKNY